MADDQPDTSTAPQTDQINDHNNATAREAATTAATNATKRKNRGNLRKRPASDSDGEPSAGAGTNNNDGGGEAIRRAQKPREAPLAFTTKREDKAETFKFESSGAAQLKNDSGATRALETETQYDRDNRAIRERMLQQAAEVHHKGDREGATAVGTGEDPSAPPGAGGEGAVYRGMTGYKDYRAGFRRENTVSGQKSTGTHGPLRASAHVRMSILVDYQPDVCKDYKETGYCGFGDSCKFLHDRGDYKSGWEIDRDWEEKQKKQRERLLQGLEGESGDEEGDDEEDELPFACFICRKPWAECQDPVVTRCKHYFCEQCALQHNAKSKKCFVCEQPTGGIFNVANDILKREKENKRKLEEGS